MKISYNCDKIDKFTEYKLYLKKQLINYIDLKNEQNQQIQENMVMDQKVEFIKEMI